MQPCVCSYVPMYVLWPSDCVRPMSVMIRARRWVGEARNVLVCDVMCAEIEKLWMSEWMCTQYGAASLSVCWRINSYHISILAPLLFACDLLVSSLSLFLRVYVVCLLPPLVCIIAQSLPPMTHSLCNFLLLFLFGRSSVRVPPILRTPHFTV